MSKEIYAMLKGEKVVLGSVNSKKQFTFREDIDMLIVRLPEIIAIGNIENKIINESFVLNIVFIL